MIPNDKSNRSSASETPSRISSRVKFASVEIREFARCIGDNPSAEGGPPLGLDWHYTDVTRDRIIRSLSSTSINSIGTSGDLSVGDPSQPSELSTIIPFAEFELMTLEKRKAKISKLLKLKEKSLKQKKAQQSREVQRRASTGNIYFKEEDGDTKAKLTSTGYKPDDDDLTEEQMKQISAKWLKLQPVPGRLRERILLEETMLTKHDIDDASRALGKLRQQRRTTVAMSETGLDEWQSVFEFCTRRLRRIRTGISKKREQELLWEKAPQYWDRKVAPTSKSTPIERKTPSCSLLRTKSAPASFAVDA